MTIHHSLNYIQHCRLSSVQCFNDMLDIPVYTVGKIINTYDCTLTQNGEIAASASAMYFVNEECSQLAIKVLYDELRELLSDRDNCT